jgi:adenylylsulfate kinase
MVLIVMAGLPGTGKTTLANALAHRLKQDIDQSTPDKDRTVPVILNKDSVRAALFPPGTIEYSTEQDDLCIDIILQVTKYLFRKIPQRPIILDGRTFSRRYQVEHVQNTAAEMGARIFWIECVCPPEIAKQRLASDINRGEHPATNRQPGLYDKMKVLAEPLSVEHLSVDTSLPLQDCVAQVKLYLTTFNEDL